MWFLEQLDKVTATRQDRVVIELRVRCEVVEFDLIHVHCLLDPWHLVNLSTVVQNGWGGFHTSSVGLEIDNVNLIKSEQCHKQSNVRQSELVACNVSLLL